MIGWLKTRRKARQAADDCEVVIAALTHTQNQAEIEIRHLETAVQPELRRAAVLRLMVVVMNCPRTTQDVEQWQAKAEAAKAQGHLNHALGLSLGCRLVGAGVLLMQLEGKEWIQASMKFAQLEGLLRAFVEHYGVQPWQGVYAFDGEFERYRLSERKRLEREEAEELALLQREEAAR